MLMAGMAGGMAWAAITAFLRDRFNANEILVSLMLVYIAQLLLSYLVHGPLMDPEGFNFPQSKMLSDGLLLPIVLPETRLHLGIVLALAPLPPAGCTCRAVSRASACRWAAWRRWPRATPASRRAARCGPRC